MEPTTQRERAPYADNGQGDAYVDNRGRTTPGYDTGYATNNRPYYGVNNGPASAASEQIMLASGGNLLLGLWLIAAPFVLTYASANARGNDIILGLLIATMAAFRVFGAYGRAWLSWANALLGVWLVVAPWVLGYSSLMHPTWNDVIVGILVIVLGVWSALSTHGTFTNANNRT